MRGWSVLVGRSVAPPRWERSGISYDGYSYTNSPLLLSCYAPFGASDDYRSELKVCHLDTSYYNLPTKFF